jgi:hypothetical protein
MADGRANIGSPASGPSHCEQAAVKLALGKVVTLTLALDGVKVHPALDGVIVYVPAASFAKKYVPDDSVVVAALQSPGPSIVSVTPARPLPLLVTMPASE